MDINTAIQTIINTLGQVEIRGIRNMDYMLGAVKLLQQIQETINAQEVTDDAASQCD